MNINNPTTFAAPNLTLSTSNSSGTSGALRADDTVAVFDATVPGTIVSAASAAAGVVSFASRRDHTHGAPTLGDVIGPGSSVDNALARYTGTTGKLLQSYTSNSPNVSDAGLMLTPGQPTVFVTLSAEVLTVTGDGTQYKIIYNTEILDTASNWDTTESEFTAPVTASYLFTVVLQLEGIATNHTAMVCRLITTQRTINLLQQSPEDTANMVPSQPQLGAGFAQIVTMDADETATFTVEVSGGSKVVAVPTYNFLGVRLLG